MFKISPATSKLTSTPSCPSFELRTVKEKAIICCEGRWLVKFTVREPVDWFHEPSALKGDGKIVLLKASAITAVFVSVSRRPRIVIADDAGRVPKDRREMVSVLSSPADGEL